MMPDIASKGIDVAQNMATQRVIGYSISKTKYKKKSVVQENLNIGVQAWEIGVILVGIAAYEYVNGGSSLLDSFMGGVEKTTTPGNPLDSLPISSTGPLTTGIGPFNGVIL